MGLKKVTWPKSSEALQHFVISLVGIILLVLFFLVVDQVISIVLENFYV